MASWESGKKPSVYCVNPGLEAATFQSVLSLITIFHAQVLSQTALLRRLSILHSRALFDTNLFDLAIDAFISLDLSPAKVVALFPLQISGKLFVEPSALEGLFGGRSQEKVLRQLEEQVGQEDEEAQRLKHNEISKKVIDDDALSVRSIQSSVGRRIGSTGSWLRDRERVAESAAGETLESIAQAAAGASPAPL